MDLRSIVEQLKSERDRIDEAITALEGVKTQTGRATKTAGKRRIGRKRRLSAEARRRISEAQKKRWARQRKTQKAK